MNSDVKHHYEGVPEPKKSMKYMFSTQNCAFSSKKNIILDVKPNYEGVSLPDFDPQTLLKIDRR